MHYSVSEISGKNLPLYGLIYNKRNTPPGFIFVVVYFIQQLYKVMLVIQLKSQRIVVVPFIFPAGKIGLE